MRKTINGFTIVELLIVIVVIGILATITTVAYTGAQQRAKVASTASALTDIDQAMRLWMIRTKSTTWPPEPTYSGGTALSQLIIDNPKLHEILKKIPDIVGIGTEEWFYDNDVDGITSSDCGDMYMGVNIVIKYIHDPKIALDVDKSIDNGDPNCGKVKWDSAAGILFYSLSYDTNFISD